MMATHSNTQRPPDPPLRRGGAGSPPGMPPGVPPPPEPFPDASPTGPPGTFTGAGAGPGAHVGPPMPGGGAGGMFDMLGSTVTAGAPSVGSVATEVGGYPTPPPARQHRRPVPEGAYKPAMSFSTRSSFALKGSFSSTVRWA